MAVQKGPKYGNKVSLKYNFENFRVTPSGGKSCAAILIVSRSLLAELRGLSFVVQGSQKHEQMNAFIGLPKLRSRL